MNPHSTVWMFIIALSSFFIKRRPLLPADCQVFNGLGYLTVEPAAFFIIGSNLTVYCQVTKCKSRSRLYLELNGKAVDTWEKVNCTMTIFNLVNVRVPQSIVLCRQQSDQLEVVGGLDLHGGLPPDKPENIICETTRSSHFIRCSWVRGQETHLPTAYNITVSRESGTQILLEHTQGAEEISIPRAIIEENTKYQLIITAYNHFGAVQSDPFTLCLKDIMIPETPHIMQITFGDSFIAAMLRWEAAKSSEHLKAYVRLRTHKGSWEVGTGTERSQGLIQVDGLKPLTEYEFQMRTCDSTSGLADTSTPSSTNSKRSFCSKWSPSVWGRSPGKGPSQPLHVWRMLSSEGMSRLQMVTVLWKPPSPEDYNGEVQLYKIIVGNDQKQEYTCPASLRQYPIEVPAEVQTVRVSAVTSYGVSPPVDVPLRHSGDPGPVLRGLAPAANGSAVLVSWLWPGNKHLPTPGEELLHYMLEWTSVPVTELQWQKLSKEQNSTSIIGLAAGVRYNVSLYAVTTRGLSAPSSNLVYSKEQKPLTGPNITVLVHEARQILIQWDELPVHQQKGFIINYTIYLQMLESSSTELNVTVSGVDPRQMWLHCPEGALALQMTASTSAGEGERGNRILSQPASSEYGLVIGIVFIITFLMVIIVNLMCWSCVRERIKQKCISWGPAWFQENLPKPGNSFAIKLLEQNGDELLLTSTYNDPPLSPISLITQEERDDVYPNVHAEISQTGSGLSTVETPLLMSDLDSGTMFVDSQLEHISYKPQIGMLALEEEEEFETEEEEEQRDAPTNDICSSVFGGLAGGFLSTVEVDFSDSPLGLTLSPFSSLLRPKTPESSCVLQGDVLLGLRETEKKMETDCQLLDLQQQVETTSNSTEDILSQYTVEVGGYFPQVAAVSSTNTLQHTDIAGTTGMAQTGQPALLN